MEFNLAQVQAAVAAAVPDRDCIVFGNWRFSYAQIDRRVRQLANALCAWDFGCHRERHELACHESGQDFLALYMTNCNEYLEGMLGAYHARMAPFSVNYRYVPGELVYLLANASASAVMYHARFAPTLAAALEELPPLRLIHVDDESGNEPLPGAVRYEQLLASSPDDSLGIALSPEDLYVVYTGGTTGPPKGVLWRQHDIYMNILSGRVLGWDEPQTLDDIIDRVMTGGPPSMTVAPLMHASAQWSALNAICAGRTFVMPATTHRFDPAEALTQAKREAVASLTIVGDAFARPMLRELETGHHDLPALTSLITGGAAMNSRVMNGLLELLPQATIIEAVGSSETGAQMSQILSHPQESTGRFTPLPGAVVASKDMTRILSPGESEIGWLAQRGFVPLGYLGDPGKTARTFPIIDGLPLAIPGVRARWHADGSIQMLGRDSVTINSGGEKIFAEEVEAAVAHHVAVYDVVVVGRPSKRWGSEVVALVQIADGADASADEIVAEAARHVARYKLPKEVLFCSRVQRSPSGKPDYRWAREQASAGLSPNGVGDPGAVSQT